MNDWTLTPMLSLNLVEWVWTLNLIEIIIFVYLSLGYRRALWFKTNLCRSKEFDFDVLMMPYDRDDLMSYENALLKFNSRQQSKSTRYSIKKISSILRKEFQIEIAKVLAKKFKLKSLFHVIYSLVIDYQWPKIICNSHYKFEFKLYTV